MWNTHLCEPGYEVTSVRSIYRHFAWLCHLHEVSAVNNRQTGRHSNVYINRFLKNEPNAWISELNYNTKQLPALKSWCFWLNLKSTGSAHRKQIFYSTVWLYSLTEILIKLYSFFLYLSFRPSCPNAVDKSSIMLTFLQLQFPSHPQIICSCIGMKDTCSTAQVAYLKTAKTPLLLLRCIYYSG